MERISRLGIVGPLVILAVGAAVVIGVLVVLHPDNTVAAAIIAAAATILTTALTVTVGRYFEKERELDAQAREKKIPIYEDFNEFMFRALMWQKTGVRKPTDQEMQKKFVDFTRGLIFWGSDDVLLTWSNWRRRFRNADEMEEEERREGLFDFEQLLIKMRRDAGYPSTKVGRGDVLALWVNDIENYV